MTKCIKCTHFPSCSGCSVQKELENLPKWKEFKAALKEFEGEIPLIVDQVVHYRHKAKLAVSCENFEIKIGLYKKGTHDVLEILDCPLHTPAINPALEKIKEALVSSGLSIYSEKTFLGVLRYVQLVEQRETGKVSLTFVVNGDASLLAAHPFFLEVQKKIGKDLHSLWINEKKTQDNAIFGTSWTLVVGDPTVVQKIACKPFYFHPASFCQVHLTIYERVIRRIELLMIKNTRVLELYAGIGVIGLCVAQSSKHIDCFENNKQAAIGFELSRAAQGTHNVSFYAKPSEEFDETIPYEVLIADPPRKGMSLQVIKKLAQVKTLKQLILLYCDSDSFIKDKKEFEELGFTLCIVETYLFFPGSDHIEVLAELKRI